MASRTVPRARPRGTVEGVAYPDSRGARRAGGNITTRSRSPLAHLERLSPLPPTRALFGRWEPHASLAQGVTDGDPAPHGRAVELPLTSHAAQLALEPT
jgi:hypothetical protein